MKEVNILSGVRPVGETQSDLGDLALFLSLEIEKHQAAGIEIHGGNVAPIWRSARGEASVSPFQESEEILIGVGRSRSPEQG
jgi:hypothetical protein